MRIHERFLSALALPCLLSLLGLLGTGCVLTQTTDGTRVLDAQIEKIVVGTSTRDDVGRLLGAPDEIIYSNLVHDALFERAFSYRRSKRRTTYFTVVVFSASRSDENNDHVVVFFDDAGIVEDVASRLDMDEPRYGAPWGADR